MGRRTALTSGAAIAFGSIVGCLGGDEEGWLVFTADADTTVDDVEIRLDRHDIRATWE